MPLSQQEAEALARLAATKEGVSARTASADAGQWVVLIRDAAGEHRITDGPAFNRWDHGNETPGAIDVPTDCERSPLRFLAWALTAIFNIIAEVGAAFHPATGTRRRTESYRGNSASRAWAARQTRRGKR